MTILRNHQILYFALLYNTISRTLIRSTFMIYVTLWKFVALYITCEWPSLKCAKLRRIYFDRLSSCFDLHPKMFWYKLGANAKVVARIGVSRNVCLKTFVDL